MKKLLVLLMSMLLLCSSAQAANFYWKDTKAALDAIAGKASGDKGIVIDSNGVVTIYTYNGSAWIAGPLTGGVIQTSKSAAYTLGTDNANEAYGGLIKFTASATLTLPEVTTSNPDMSFCTIAVGAYTITIDPNANDGIITTHLSATRDANGDNISNSSAATGDMICLIADSASGWLTLGSRGTWAQQ